MSGGRTRGTGVEGLVRRDRAAAAAVLGASHADYPGFAWLWPDPAVRRRALRPFLRATVADVVANGSAMVGRDGQGVCAVALWLPPGSFPWSPGRKLRAVPALARTALAAPRAFPAFAALGASAERSHPDEPHWSLEVLGVHPRAQGEGWGGELVRAGLARADADGAACWVETSDPADVGFYRAVGFEVAEPRLEHLPGGPTHTGLRRPPRGDPRHRDPRSTDVGGGWDVEIACLAPSQEQARPRPVVPGHTRRGRTPWPSTCCSSTTAADRPG